MQGSRTEFYLQRYGFCGRQISNPPHPALGLVVVIPCFDEPDLRGTLLSLRHCRLPDPAVEVIVVINSGANCASEIRARNAQTFADASEWARDQSEEHLRFHILHCPDLPPKRAGVGLARKIGMDEAALRLDQAGRLGAGVIACLDADCRCDPNYLAEIVNHFHTQADCPGCSIYFEHPIDESFSADARNAITCYELHLRYYVQALRFAQFPYAHHTVGSAMAVRAEVYLCQGGMNKRQAGEDFYFLEKIMPLGGYADIVTTRVVPSARPSHRVPFGTGRAVRDFLDTGARATYPFQAFVDLKTFLGLLDGPAARDPLYWRANRGALSPALQGFLEEMHFERALEEMRANSTAPASFRKRFFQWLDGFAVMKWVHYARDHQYGAGDLGVDPCLLLGRPVPRESERGLPFLTELLLLFRRLDRGE